MFADATIAVPNIQAGKVIALGHVRGEADDAAAGGPADRRDRPGFDWQAWQGIVAPAGTPDGDRRPAVRRDAEDPGHAGIQGAARRFGMEPSAPHTPAEFAAIIRAEQPRWAKAIKDSGAKVD